MKRQSSCTGNILGSQTYSVPILIHQVNDWSEKHVVDN